MRKLGVGLLIGVAVAYFVRWRGGFSQAADEIRDRLPDAETPDEWPAEAPPEMSEQPTQVSAGDPNDSVLVDRVRSEVFRDERFRGNVNVAAEYGRVVLHGALEQPELIDELVNAVRRVEGVRDVESRLHLSRAEPRSE